MELRASGALTGVSSTLGSKLAGGLTKQWLKLTAALQRLHAATFRGVAMLINPRPVLRTGPEVPQEASPLPVPPRPRGR